MCGSFTHHRMKQVRIPPVVLRKGERLIFELHGEGIMRVSCIQDGADDKRGGVWADTTLNVEVLEAPGHALADLVRADLGRLPH